MENQTVNPEYLVILLAICSFIISASVLIVLYFQKQYLLIKKMRRMYLDLGEDEREKLSFEIHHESAAATVRLESYIKQADMAEESKNELFRIVSEMKYNIALINDRIFPGNIEGIPFEASLMDISSLCGNCEFKLHYHSELLDHLSRIVKTHIYRIIQEICMNAVRHSFPEFIEISIEDTGMSVIEIEIVYNSNHAEAIRTMPNSRGKKILKERLLRMGGEHRVKKNGNIIIESIKLHGN
jgi:signal transduction histidine kinase